MTSIFDTGNTLQKPNNTPITPGGRIKPNSTSPNNHTVINITNNETDNNESCGHPIKVHNLTKTPKVSGLLINSSNDGESDDDEMNKNNITLFENKTKDEEIGIDNITDLIKEGLTDVIGDKKKLSTALKGAVGTAGGLVWVAVLILFIILLKKL